MRPRWFRLLASLLLLVAAGWGVFGYYSSQRRQFRADLGQAKNDLAAGRYWTPFDRIGLAIHIAATSVAIVITAVLWSRWRLSKWNLRALDYLILVTPVAFFAWFQWDMFSFEREILGLPRETMLSVAEDRADSCMLRWFALIVLYGWQPVPFLVLIPIVCWSRVYLKAHTVAQVIVGAGLGALSVLVFFHIFHLV